MDVGLDFHGRLHKPMAKQLARLLEPLGLLFIEEPLLSENPEGITQISQLVSTRSHWGRRLLFPLGFQTLSGVRRGRYHSA